VILTTKVVSKHMLYPVLALPLVELGGCLGH